MSQEKKTPGKLSAAAERIDTENHANAMTRFKWREDTALATIADPEMSHVHEKQQQALADIRAERDEYLKSRGD